MRKVVALPTVVALAAFVLLASGGLTVQAASQRVFIKADEFFFEPKEVTVKPGKVVFAVKNEGVIEHNFIIETSDRKKVAEIPILKPQESEDVEVNLRAGNYTFVCTLTGHREAGMVGKLTVKP